MKKEYILLLVIVVFASCKTKPDFTKDNLYPPPDIVIPYHSDWTKNHYPEKIKEFEANPLSFGDIVFIGNSITEFGGDWGKRFNNPKIKNRGISGDVTEGVLNRLGEIYYYKPTAVFLKIGINDLFNESLSSEYVGNNIVKIVKNIKKYSPKTAVYAQTILPTSNEKMITKIQATNAILKNNSKKYGYTLIDLHSAFADKNDLMIKDYTVDGVHLSEAGYTVWVDFIKAYLTDKKE
ncbi:GDSL-type esterase/lipase family protein [Flavobacterium sp.]|uniref:GDSL-type esterase/lipase family protein n=1 Tax=Flavobacterium sp. TaxID=239 RepID=UPI00286D2919|nr:GDSL-type esterase/lipase family protein [Flavobacterium sp.]